MYAIVIKKSAIKELAQITPPFNKKIAEAIDSLAINPRPDGVKKLKGDEAYRIRVSDYRIIYTIEDVIKVVEVQRIRHRKDVYKSY
jgi:mRNA interferase RelE/StbE